MVTIKMKYHYKFPKDTVSACGTTVDKPDTFVFDMKGFVEHTNDNDRCKTCKRIVQDMSKLGYVSLSNMIIIDNWKN